MNNGLYEKILDNNIKQLLEEKNYKEVRNVDRSEVANVLSIAYQKIIREILLQKDSDKEKQEIIKELNYEENRLFYSLYRLFKFI